MSLKRGRSNENLHLASNEIPQHPRKMGGGRPEAAPYNRPHRAALDDGRNLDLGSRTATVVAAPMGTKNIEEQLLDLERHRERLRSLPSDDKVQYLEGHNIDLDTTQKHGQPGRGCPPFSTNGIGAGVAENIPTHPENIPGYSPGYIGMDMAPMSFHTLHNQGGNPHTRMFITPNPNSTMAHGHDAGGPGAVWSAAELAISGPGGLNAQRVGSHGHPATHAVPRGDLTTRLPTNGLAPAGLGHDVGQVHGVVHGAGHGAASSSAPPGSALQEALLNLARGAEAQSQLSLRSRLPGTPSSHHAGSHRLQLDASQSQPLDRHQVHGQASSQVQEQQGHQGQGQPHSQNHHAHHVQPHPHESYGPTVSGVGGALYPFSAATTANTLYPGGYPATLPPPPPGFHDSHTAASSVGVYSNQNMQPPSTSQSNEYDSVLAPGTSLLADTAIASNRVSIHLKGLPSNLNLDPSLPALVYTELINFGRCKKRSGSRHCVMCGRSAGGECVIPTQNKGTVSGRGCFWIFAAAVRHSLTALSLS